MNIVTLAFCWPIAAHHNFSRDYERYDFGIFLPVATPARFSNRAATMNIVTLAFCWPIAAHAQFFNEAMTDAILESFCRSQHPCAIFKQGRNYEHRDSGILLAYRGTCTIFQRGYERYDFGIFLPVATPLRDFQIGPQL